MLQVQQRYKKATGYMPFLFEGSSPGAGKFGYLKIRRRAAPKKANTGNDHAAVTVENSSWSLLIVQYLRNFYLHCLSRNMYSLVTFWTIFIYYLTFTLIMIFFTKVYMAVNSEQKTLFELLFGCFLMYLVFPHIKIIWSQMEININHMEVSLKIILDKI